MPTAILVEENITRESGGVLSVPIQNASPKGASRGKGERSRACAHFFLPMPARAGISKMEIQMKERGRQLLVAALALSIRQFYAFSL
jgi:hypothetical protein